MIRSECIRQHRLRQPLRELQRKMQKSHERARIWTQEEMDYADAVAAKLRIKLRRPEILPGDEVLLPDKAPE